MSLATPELLASAVDQEHSGQALAKLFAVLHVAVRLDALVVVREIDENELRIAGLFQNNVVQLLR